MFHSIFNIKNNLIRKILSVLYFPLNFIFFIPLSLIQGVLFKKQYILTYYVLFKCSYYQDKVALDELLDILNVVRKEGK